jgi:hypothetical protein
MPGGTVPMLYARTLERAAVLVGGMDQLARHLHVTPSHLARWLAGKEPVPPGVFLRAVDLIAAREDTTDPES